MSGDHRKINLPDNKASSQYLLVLAKIDSTYMANIVVYY